MPHWERWKLKSVQTSPDGELQTVQISNSSQSFKAVTASTRPQRSHLEEAHTERNSQHSTKSLTSPSPREGQGGAGTSVATCMTQQGCSLWTGPCSPAAHGRSLGELQSCAGPSLPRLTALIYTCVCLE